MSIMLVAFASFVLHGSAMARPAPMHAASAAPSFYDDEGGAHDHRHASVDTDHHGGRTDATDHHGSKGLCCGTFCAAAIAPLVLDATVSRTVTSVVLPVSEENGNGLVRESLRKPPRTPDIA